MVTLVRQVLVLMVEVRAVVMLRGPLFGSQAAPNRRLLLTGHLRTLHLLRLLVALLPSRLMHKLRAFLPLSAQNSPSGMMWRLLELHPIHPTHRPLSHHQLHCQHQHQHQHQLLHVQLQLQLLHLLLSMLLLPLTICSLH